MANTFTRLRKCVLVLVLSATLLCQSGFTAPAYADDPLPMTDMASCTKDANLKPEQITSQVIYCVRLAITTAVNKALTELQNYMANTITIAMVIAVIVLGIRLLGGESELNGKTMALLFRLALVYMFTHGDNMMHVANWCFAITDWLSDLVTPNPGWTPWAQIDAFLGKIYGFAPGLTLVNGVVGVIFAAATSASTGAAMFGSAMMALWDLMMFVLDVVYAYLTALLVIGFMIIISPFVLPLALFHYTERFFKKWLNTIFGAMIMPMLLFGFLAQGLQVFDTLITKAISNLSDDIEDAKGNPSFAKFWRTNQSKYGWLVPADANQVEGLTAGKRGWINRGGTDKVYPAQATENFPNNRTAMDMNMTNFLGADYDHSQLKKIMLSFLSLWIYAKLLKGLIHKMPEVASAISASVMLSMQPTNFKDKVEQVKRDTGAGFGAIAGGWMGSKMGNTVGGKRAQSLGAIAGITLGGAAGERISVEAVNRVGDAINKQISGLVGNRK